MVYFSKLPARLSGVVLEPLQGDEQESLPELEKGKVIEAKVLKLLSEDRATLLVMGKKITVSTMIPLKAGETVKLQVTTEGAKLVLRFIGDISGGNSQPFFGKLPTTSDNSHSASGHTLLSPVKPPPSFEKSLVAFKISELPLPMDDPLPSLINNQVVEAKILKVLSENRATFLIMGRKITVESPIPLKEGETLKLQVPVSGSKQVLHLVDDRQPSTYERHGAALKIIAPNASSDTPLPLLKSDQTVEAKILKNLPNNRATLLIKGREVTAEPFIPLKTGETLRLQLAETGSKQVLRLVDDTARPSIEKTPVSFKMIQPRGFSGSSTLLPDLKPNQVVEAGILKKLPGNRVSLLVMGKEITVEPFVPLKEGATVKLKVVGNGQRQVLQLTGETPDAFYEKPLAALKNLGRPGPFTPLIDLIREKPLQENMLHDPLHQAGRKSATGGNTLRETVKEMLGQLALDPDHLEPEVLKNLIRKSGMVWEDKLNKALADRDASPIPSGLGAELEKNDLKARIMTLIKDAPDETSPIVHSLKSFVEGMENLQMVNSQSGAESGKFLMPLPFLFGGTFHFGQLFIDTNRPGGGKNGTNERMMSVALLLDMSNLGQVRADFSIFKKAVSGEFLVETTRTRDFIVKQLPSLVEHLEKNGYAVRKAGCSVVDPMTLKNTSLTEMVDSEKSGMLNVVI